MISRIRCRPAAGRDLTTNALQQFFVMNSAFMHDEAAALVKIVDDGDRAMRPRCGCFTARFSRAIRAPRNWIWR